MRAFLLLSRHASWYVCKSKTRYELVSLCMHECAGQWGGDGRVRRRWEEAEEKVRRDEEEARRGWGGGEKGWGGEEEVRRRKGEGEDKAKRKRGEGEEGGRKRRGARAGGARWPLASPPSWDGWIGPLRWQAGQESLIVVEIDFSSLIMDGNVTDWLC